MYTGLGKPTDLLSQLETLGLMLLLILESIGEGQVRSPVQVFY